MLEKARVVEIKEGKVKAEIRRATACGESCGSCKGGCAPSNTYVDVANSMNAKLGDYIEIEMSTKTFLTAVVLTYGIPLVMLFIGIFLGSVWLRSDIASVVLGFSLMALSYLVVSRKDQRLKKEEAIHFKMTRIL